ncbi:hypothetical protein V9K67_09895 [Paraflavisolibacter sp. H34]|uniref:hypothetical protein n=1 Tax=Huijunlia imazamoxiresistens TaxID=3127457 RepID=UPI0030191FFF
MAEDKKKDELPEDPDDLRLENEILKLKLQAEMGAHFESSEELPPELEHQFLQQVVAFEEASRTVQTRKVYDILGQPSFRRLEELKPQEISPELNRLYGLLEARNMELDILGQYDDVIIYRFITEELFEHETDDFNLPGMIIHFTYEEFHPNHKMDMEERTREFFNDWFERRMNEYSWELGQNFVLPDARQLGREQVLAKLKAFFDAFPVFSEPAYQVDEIAFQWNEEAKTGLGHVEGTVHYSAQMESGEEVEWEGPFKLYLSNDQGWWSIFYFIMPGFNWE